MGVVDTFGLGLANENFVATHPSQNAPIKLSVENGQKRHKKYTA
jgi:hypothetical protein